MENSSRSVAVVTGAGSGIGKEVAKRFEKLGCRLVLIDKDLKEIRRELSGCHDHSFFEINVSHQESVYAAFKQVEKQNGRIDYAFNGAGIGGVFASVENYPVEEWHKVIDVNLNAVFLCMKYEISLMLKSGGGSIVNCASLLSTVGYANDSAYVASKHAVIGLTKSAALEYAELGIRINAVSPGFTHTAMTNNYPGDIRKAIEDRHAMKRFANTSEIADAVLWLSSPQASFVCGHNLIVDGGYTIE
jgi:NAD(P)-dependent dehydrogenase (short-subunit alcohol dehydrogenase family)